MANLLEEVQQYVADKLNADPQLSACPFLVENKRDIDYEIKNALGREGIVGLVMTPKATYAGAYMDVGIAWQIDELEIDVVENVTVNRGKKDNNFITGQDAAMRLFEVLCPLSGEHEGQFNPVSYSEGEDNSLLVNKSVLKCLVHKLPSPEMRTKVVYRDGTTTYLDIRGELSQESIPGKENLVSADIGNAVTSIGEWAFAYCDGLASMNIPNSVSAIGSSAFQGCSGLASVAFSGKDMETVQAMDNYGWGLPAGCILHCTDGDITLVDYSKLLLWKTDGEMVEADAPAIVTSQIVEQALYPSQRSTVAKAHIPDSVTEIGYGVFFGCEHLTSIYIGNSVAKIGGDVFFNCSSLQTLTIPATVTSIGDYAFYGCSSLTGVTFKGKTLQQVRAMNGYPWGISNTSIIHAELG